MAAIDYNTPFKILPLSLSNTYFFLARNGPFYYCYLSFFSLFMKTKACLAWGNEIESNSASYEKSTAFKM